jgi:HEPN domain-containing protein
MREPGCSLLNGLVVQASGLANTAIEKYLKAVFSFSGLQVPHWHNPLKLYEAILSAQSSTLKLNREFLGLLHKAYTIRYPDDLKEGFNVALNQAKILAELDRSVLEITSRFRFVANGKPIPMLLDKAATNEDKQFLDKNVALDPSQAKPLFSETSNSYEIRIYKGNLLEASYQNKRCFGRPDLQGCISAPNQTKITQGGNPGTVRRPHQKIPAQAELGRATLENQINESG